MAKSGFLFLFLLGGFTCYSQLTIQGLQKITILDNRNGFGNWREKSYNLVPNNHAFALTEGGANNTKEIPDSIIENLLSALSDTGFYSLNGALKMFTNDYLSKQVPEIVKRSTARMRHSDKDIQRLIRELSDSSKFWALFKQQYNSSWTDDYSGTELKFIYATDTITIISVSQQKGMLPWCGLNIVSYNPKIPYLINKILPTDAINFYRRKFEDIYFGEWYLEKILGAHHR